MKKLLALIITVSLATTQAQASWLSEITGINVDIPNGTIEFNRPKPQAIPEMLRNLPQDVGRAVLNPAGAGLATAIRASYGQLRSSAVPIPPQTRQALAPFFPGAVLDKARYTYQDRANFSITNFVIRCSGNTAAVTVDNIIVFRGPTEAQDPVLWAHELVHVGQYDRLGVEGFAHFYSIDWNGMENEAYSWQNYVQNQMQTNPSFEQQQYYSVASSNPTAPYTDQQWVQAAQQAVPAGVCAVWQGRVGPYGNYGATVSNVCRVPIRITGWHQAVPPYGQPAWIQCSVNCVLRPMSSDEAWSNLPGPMISLYFDYM